MTDQELEDILKEHCLWLDSNGNKGKIANLRGVDLRRENFKAVDLRNVNLEGVDLRRADLRGANLEGANLKGADLRNVNLEGVDLKGANLEGANLEGADLQGVNLEGCYVSPGTKILGNMLITEYYDKYPSFWIVKSWVELDEEGLGKELYK